MTNYFQIYQKYNRNIAESKRKNSNSNLTSFKSEVKTQPSNLNPSAAHKKIPHTKSNGEEGTRSKRNLYANMFLALSLIGEDEKKDMQRIRSEYTKNGNGGNVNQELHSNHSRILKSSAKIDPHVKSMYSSCVNGDSSGRRTVVDKNKVETTGSRHYAVRSEPFTGRQAEYNHKSKTTERPPATTLSMKNRHTTCYDSKALSTCPSTKIPSQELDTVAVRGQRHHQYKSGTQQPSEKCVLESRKGRSRFQENALTALQEIQNHKKNRRIINQQLDAKTITVKRNQHLSGDSSVASDASENNSRQPHLSDADSINSDNTSGSSSSSSSQEQKRHEKLKHVKHAKRHVRIYENRCIRTSDSSENASSNGQKQRRRHEKLRHAKRHIKHYESTTTNESTISIQQRNEMLRQAKRHIRTSYRTNDESESESNSNSQQSSRHDKLRHAKQRIRKH